MLQNNSIVLSITIVNYNMREMLEPCLKSVILYTTGINYEIIVIDNNSTDESVEMVRNLFPQVKAIQNKNNRYVAGGFNQAFEQSSGKYIVIMDPDIEIKDNVFLKLINFLERNQTIGAVGTRLYSPNNELYTFCYNRDNNWWYLFFNFTLIGRMFRKQKEKLRKQFYYNGWDRKTSRYVDWVDTALTVRRVVFEQVGFYDENFKLYFIQNDLCKRVREAGWGVYYWAEGKIIHKISQGINKENFSKISSIYRHDMEHFISKYYRLIPAKLLMFLINITRILLHFFLLFNLYQPKKNIVFGTLPK